MLLLVASSTLAMAQQNTFVKFYKGTMDYKKPSAFNSVLGVMTALGSDPSLDLEDKSISDQLAEAIFQAPETVYRLKVQSEECPQKTSDEAYALDFTLKNVMTTFGDKKRCSADMEMRIVDLRTGEVFEKDKASCCCFGYAWDTEAECVSGLCNIMKYRTAMFLWNTFPMTGTILQKGVEQNNGKIKDNQCYIDLGEKNLVFKKMRFKAYTLDGDKEKKLGYLKVTEVEGDDISVCKISSGTSKIEKALQAGQTVYIKTDINQDCYY